MSGVLLATVPSEVRNFNPNLGQLYLAASLRKAGIDVRLLDLASLYGPSDIETLAAAIDDQKPEILGFTLYTETVLYGYDLIELLEDTAGLCIVAGGPHATAEPAEVLEHGFDLAVVGEGEETLVDLVGSLRSGGSLADVPGLAWLDDAGRLQTSLELQCQRCLQALDMPLELDFRLMIDASDELVRDSSLDTLYSDDGFIDLYEVVEDELILAIPLVPLHEDVSCNEYWLAADSEAEPAEKENPFAVLRQLKTTD